MKNTPVAMISVLAIICLAVSAVLGFVNFLTEDTIARIAEEKVQAAMADIIPNATFELDSIYTLAPDLMQHLSRLMHRHTLL